MNNLNEPLSDEELDELDAFMLDRFPDDDNEAEDPGNEGLLSLIELDGFLTAIVSGPETVPPSVWLPALWGDQPPAWQDEAQFMHVMNLLMRHMNTIAWLLMNVPDEYEPLTGQREIDGEVFDIPDDWCEGYMYAVNLSASAWDGGGAELQQLLSPLRDFCEEGEWRAHDFGEEHRARLAAQVPANVRAIHAFWLARRSPPQPIRSAGPNAGRNDPCPCGSGRKYKKCCLQ